MIIIIFHNKLPGTKSPKGQLKLKNAEDPLDFSPVSVFFQSISPQSSITTFLLVFPDLEPKPSIWEKENCESKGNKSHQEEVLPF